MTLVTELGRVRDEFSLPPFTLGARPFGGGSAPLGNGSPLARARRGQKLLHTLCMRDERTVGLHMADLARVIRVLRRLVDSGHRVALAGTPEKVVRAATHTGVALAPVLQRRRVAA